MGFDNECVMRIESVRREFFCVNCRTLVYPNEALQAPCKHLFCKSCLADLQACPDDLSPLIEINCKPLLESNQSLAEMIGEVMVVRPQTQVASGKAQPLTTATQPSVVGSTVANIAGTTAVVSSLVSACTDKPMSYVAIEQPLTHRSSGPIQNLQEVAGKYANAHYLWTWHEKKVKGQSVLSGIKDHNEGMSVFFAASSALEANVRVLGSNVNELSPYELCDQYIQKNKEPSFSQLSALEKIAQILKDTGAVPQTSNGTPSTFEKRIKISEYKVFNTKTPEGLSEVLDHLRVYGPLTRCILCDQPSKEK